MATTVYALATSSAVGVDLVAGNSEDGNVLLRNRGGQFERHVLPGGRPDPKAAVVGDLNGDGLDDIIFGGWPNVSLTMLRNDGRGFVAVVLPGMPKLDGSNASWTEALALADVDGDGDLDLLVGNNEEPNYLLRNDGVAGFAPGVPLPGSPTLVTGALAVGDVNGDGHVDLLEAVSLTLVHKVKHHLEHSACCIAYAPNHDEPVFLGHHKTPFSCPHLIIILRKPFCFKPSCFKSCFSGCSQRLLPREHRKTSCQRHIPG